MENEMKVIRCRYLLAMAVCFTFGLVFGLLCHLPTVSFLDDTDAQFVAVAVETDQMRWRGGNRLNGRPIGVRKRTLQHAAELSVTITTRPLQAKPHAMNTPSKPAFDSLNHVVDGIYWSKSLEETVPKGFTDNDLDNWRQFAHQNKVVDLQEGCGRMQNRLVTFEDGTQSCARYRINTDQIQGEVYSFYLARLLGIYNIPPLAMLTADQRQNQWKSVSGRVTEARWSDEKPIVLTKFVGNLVPAFIPASLRPDDRKVSPDDLLLLAKGHDELVELVQWSDLIVLDYLTGNLDRVVNNMFNKQWNSEIMDGPAHNLEKTENFLLFLDNESGLFHGYRLLDKYQSYHEQLLKSLCIFRRETVARLSNYYRNGRIGDDLHTSVQTNERHADLLPSIPEKNLEVLRERIGHVLDQVTACQNVGR